MRFSVIVPLYNKAPYVRKALESVINQSFTDFELIVVDDGSIDDSFSITKVVLDQSEVLYQLVRQKNMGVSTARNNGVAQSHGDYICFLDADDWWDELFLEKMDKLIDAYPEAGIYGTNYYYVKNGNKRVCVTNAETGLINYCKLYAETLVMPLTSSSIAVSRRIFDEMQGFRPHLKKGEDFDLWIKIALKYEVAFLNEPLAYYYQDANPVWRGTGHLVSPDSHMLWNLEHLSAQEKIDSDYKKLVDELRCSGLLRYYISKKFRQSAVEELKKVDWSLQSQKVRNLYKLPICVLIIRRDLLSLGSKVKQWITRVLRLV